MIKILKNKKGVTLMELIVGLFLFAVVTTSVAAIVAPILRAHAHASDLAEVNTLLDNLANIIISDLSSATDALVISGDDDDDDDENRYEVLIRIDNTNVIYTVEDDENNPNFGALLRSVSVNAPDPVFHPVLPKIFYKRKSVSFVVNDAPTTVNGEAYTLTVTILSDRTGSEMISREMISREYAVRPLALNQAD
jgi:type II secretory pathway component PulJ